MKNKTESQSPHPLQGLSTMDSYAVNDAWTNSRKQNRSIIMHMQQWANPTHKQLYILKHKNQRKESQNQGFEPVHRTKMKTRNFLEQKKLFRLSQHNQ